MADWQLIETAPRTGEPILCARGKNRYIARWWTSDDSGGWSLDLGGDDECVVLPAEYGPTHYQLLPEPPCAN